MERRYMDTNLKPADFIYPYFVVEGRNKKERIKSFPGVFRFSVDTLLKDIQEVRGLGINKVLLFGLPEYKNSGGTFAYKKGNIAAAAVKDIKKRFPGLTVMTDVCLCAYTTHGHCGIIKNGRQSPVASRWKNSQLIDNGQTLKILAKIALSHAEAGADYVAPSAMAKRQVLVIRNALDKSGFSGTGIMGYSAKFASNFYGPFREAAASAPKFGDRSGYQLYFGDAKEALKEAADDIKEGADIIMVKPALAYLDVIKEVKTKFRKPLAAYNVSGEYAMVKGYSRQSNIERDLVLEVLTCIKRAGADFIITYHAKDAARWLKEGR